MRLFAIGDLHLPGGDDKPMNVFGDHWEGHFEKIAADWVQKVSPEDVVLIPGDISWAMQLQDAESDLEAISRLPGRKILCKGNHDYWWSSIGKVRKALPEGMTALQHNAADLGDLVVCGTRGWTFPTRDTALSEEDLRIMERELIRLQLALDQAVKIAGSRPIWVMLHYPPLYDMERETPFTGILEKYPVQRVIYGHLHGAGIRVGYSGEWNGIDYRLVSCDSLDFSLMELPLQQ